MIKRQISFLFEDPGFCIDVFCTIAEPVRYYNRDTESGAWYSSTPDWNENGSLIREDLIFEVIADGVVCALDGNGNFEGKKPFLPIPPIAGAVRSYTISAPAESGSTKGKAALPAGCQRNGWAWLVLGKLALCHRF